MRFEHIVSLCRSPVGPPSLFVEQRPILLFGQWDMTYKPIAEARRTHLQCMTLPIPYETGRIFLEETLRCFNITSFDLNQHPLDIHRGRLDRLTAVRVGTAGDRDTTRVDPFTLKYSPRIRMPTKAIPALPACKRLNGFDGSSCEHETYTGHYGDFH